MAAQVDAGQGTAFYTRHSPEPQALNPSEEQSVGVKTYYLLSNEHGNFVGMRAFSWLKERLAARSRTATGGFEVRPGNWRKQIEPLYAFLRRHSSSVGQLQKLKCANPRKDRLYNSLVPKRKAKKTAPRPAVAPAAPRQEHFAIREGRMVRLHI